MSTNCSIHPHGNQPFTSYALSANLLNILSHSSHQPRIGLHETRQSVLFDEILHRSHSATHGQRNSGYTSSSIGRPFNHNGSPHINGSSLQLKRWMDRLCSKQQHEVAHYAFSFLQEKHLQATIDIF
uniref:Uncharacterized protein n=1 Tax=Oryza meridionalis TaxID=40149 RepID=A0A0E0EHB0_9ORYZ